MKVSTEIDNNFGNEKITQLVDNIPLNRRIIQAVGGYGGHSDFILHEAKVHLHTVIVIRL